MYSTATIDAIVNDMSSFYSSHSVSNTFRKTSSLCANDDSPHNGINQGHVQQWDILWDDVPSGQATLADSSSCCYCSWTSKLNILWLWRFRCPFVSSHPAGSLLQFSWCSCRNLNWWHSAHNEEALWHLASHNIIVQPSCFSLLSDGEWHLWFCNTWA